MMLAGAVGAWAENTWNNGLRDAYRREKIALAYSEQAIRTFWATAPLEAGQARSS